MAAPNSPLSIAELVKQARTPPTIDNAMDLPIHYKFSFMIFAEAQEEEQQGHIDKSFSLYIKFIWMTQNLIPTHRSFGNFPLLWKDAKQKIKIAQNKKEFLQQQLETQSLHSHGLLKYNQPSTSQYQTHNTPEDSLRQFRNFLSSSQDPSSPIPIEKDTTMISHPMSLSEMRKAIEKIQPKPPAQEQQTIHPSVPPAYIPDPQSTVYEQTNNIGDNNNIEDGELRLSIEEMIENLRKSSDAIDNSLRSQTPSPRPNVYSDSDRRYEQPFSSLPNSSEEEKRKPLSVDAFPLLMKWNSEDITQNNNIEVDGNDTFDVPSSFYETSHTISRESHNNLPNHESGTHGHSYDDSMSYESSTPSQYYVTPDPIEPSYLVPSAQSFQQESFYNELPSIPQPFSAQSFVQVEAPEHETAPPMPFPPVGQEEPEVIEGGLGQFVLVGQDIKLICPTSGHLIELPQGVHVVPDDISLPPSTFLIPEQSDGTFILPDGTQLIPIHIQ